MNKVIFLGIGAGTIYASYRLGKLVGRLKEMDDIIKLIDKERPGFRNEVYGSLFLAMVMGKARPEEK